MVYKHCLNQSNAIIMPQPLDISGSDFLLFSQLNRHMEVGGRTKAKIFGHTANCKYLKALSGEVLVIVNIYLRGKSFMSSE